MTTQAKDYPLRKLTDARTAVAQRFSAFLAGLEFGLPQTTEPFKLAKVYSTWSSFEQRAMSAGGLLPAAAVLPDRPVYEAASFGPRMLEETWSGGDPTDTKADGRPRYPNGDGSGDGFALFEVAQLAVPLVVLFRAKTKGQRQAIVSRIEEVLVEDGSALPDASSLNPDVPVLAELRPVRYGLLLDAPRYFGRRIRYTLEAQQLLDTESTSAENRWLDQFEIAGHVQVCVLRRVRAMKARVEVVVGGAPETRSLIVG